MTSRFPLVDVLRGLAALLVVWYHVIEVSQWNTFPVHGIYLLPRVGWIGVDLFFIISGFVIGRSALTSIAKQPEDWRAAFWERRMRRILPLYFATLFIFMFLVQPGILTLGLVSLGHVVSHILMLHHFLPSTSGSINGPNWSVALEMQFYLLMLVVTPWIAKRSVWSVLVVWVAFALAWRYFSTWIHPPGVSDATTQRVLAMQLPGVLDLFALGIVLAKLAETGYLAFSWTRLAIALAVTVGCLSAAWITFWPRAHYWHLMEMIVFWRLLLGVGFAGLLAVFLLMPQVKSWWLRPWTYLGEISYGIYLWHFPVLLVMLEKTTWRGDSLLKATLIATLVLAALSWHGFEKLWLSKQAAPRAPQ